MQQIKYPEMQKVKLTPNKAKILKEAEIEEIKHLQISRAVNLSSRANNELDLLSSSPRRDCVTGST